MAYYTILQGIGVTNLMTTFTHGLSITPANLVARPILRNGTYGLLYTSPLAVGTVGTNIVTVAAGPATIMTFDLEVQQIHSINL